MSEDLALCQSLQSEDLNVYPASNSVLFIFALCSYSEEWGLAKSALGHNSISILQFLARINTSIIYLNSMTVLFKREIWS